MASYKTVSELQDAIHDGSRQYKEIWVSPDGRQHMCALINGTVGWIMYISDEYESGLCTHNDTYEGDGDIDIEYFLDNGQRDLYPARWALPVPEVEKALVLFLDSGELDSSLTWQEHDR